MHDNNIFLFVKNVLLRKMIYMIDIKQEIQVLLLRQGLSMSKMTRNMNQKGLAKTNVASLSKNAFLKNHKV